MHKLVIDTIKHVIVTRESNIISQTLLQLTVLCSVYSDVMRASIQHH